MGNQANGTPGSTPAPLAAQPAAGTRGTRAILAASVGNLLEWYDFSVYALFAIYIAAIFFPHRDSGLDLVKTFLVFGLGFVIRPLGAILIGIYGDRAGRKAALTLTILIMASGTLVIAVAPSYAAIGLGAPLLLLAGRILQGFSAGGEIGSADRLPGGTRAPPIKRGRFTAWLQASMGYVEYLGRTGRLRRHDAVAGGAGCRLGLANPLFSSDC